VSILTYNSRSPASSEFGYGWSAFPRYKLTAVSSFETDITTGTGLVQRYCLGASGWQPPPFAPYGLVKNGDGTWTQTQPDGFQLHFDTTGKVNRMADGSGNRWTYTYDNANRLTRILTPLNRRTTFTYAGAVNVLLQSIQDAAGRTTSFRMDANQNLVQMVGPDSSVVTLSYDTNHRLTSFRDPLGNRTSYTHQVTTDGNGWLRRITAPNGGRTTYTYLDWLTTQVTDPAGQLTTVLHDQARDIQATINPKGQRATYTWFNGKPAASFNRRPREPGRLRLHVVAGQPDLWTPDDSGRPGRGLLVRLRQLRPGETAGGPTGKPRDVGPGIPTGTARGCSMRWGIERRSCTTVCGR